MSTFKWRRCHHSLLNVLAFHSTHQTIKTRTKKSFLTPPFFFFSIALKFTAEHGLNGAHVPLLLLFPLLILSLTFAGETRTRFTESVRPSLAQEVQSPTLIKWSNNRSFYFFTSLAMSDNDHQVSSWVGEGRVFIIIWTRLYTTATNDLNPMLLFS